MARPNRNNELFAATVNLISGLLCSAAIVAIAHDPPRPDLGIPAFHGHAVPISIFIEYGLAIGLAIAVSIAWCGIVQLLLKNSSNG